MILGWFGLRLDYISPNSFYVGYLILLSILVISLHVLVCLRSISVIIWLVISRVFPERTYASSFESVQFVHFKTVNTAWNNFRFGQQTQQSGPL